jgi:hypothetical protein
VDRMIIEIPHCTWDDPSVGFHARDLSQPNMPAWEQPTTSEGVKCRPIIRCNCGRWCGIGAHHVHADGTVTASFFHAHSSTGLKYSTDDGCDWHVFLKLQDYSGGEFLPEA